MILKVIMCQMPFIRYHKVMGLVSFVVQKTFGSDLFTYQILCYMIEYVFPTNYFRIDYRSTVRNIFIKVIGRLAGQLFQEFKKYFVIAQVKDKVMMENDEGYLYLVDIIVQNQMDILFYQPKQMQSFIRLLDYFLVLKDEFVVLAQIKIIDLMRQEIQAQVLKKISTKSPSPQDIIFACQSIQPIIRNPKYLCFGVQKQVEGILNNSVYSDMFKYQFLRQASIVIEEELDEKLESSTRIQQIRRVIGILFVKKDEITKEKHQQIIEILDRRKQSQWDVKSLFSALYYKKQQLLKEESLNIIFSLCNVDGDKVKDIEFRFMIILLTRAKSEVKLSQLIVLICDYQNQPNLLNKGQVCLVLQQFEQLLDPKLNYYNKGSTLMHVTKEKLSRHEIVMTIISEEQGFYLYYVILNIQGVKIQANSRQLQKCHFMKHMSYLRQKQKEEQKNEQQSISGAAEKVRKNNEFENVYEDGKHDKMYQKYRQNVKPQAKVDYDSMDSDEEEVVEVDKRKVFLDNKVTVDELHQYKVDRGMKYGQALVTLEEDNRERYTTGFFDDLADNILVNPLSKLGGFFSFSNNISLVTENNVVKEEGNMMRTQMKTRQSSGMGLENNVEIDREILDDKIDEEYEKERKMAMGVSRDWMNYMYQNIYIEAVVKMVDKNTVNKGMKDQQAQILIETEVSRHDFELSANMDDLEVFVYGMNKKDQMVDQSAIVLRNELLEDDPIEVRERKKREQEMQQQIEEEVENQVQIANQLIQEKYDRLDQDNQERMQIELDKIRMEYENKQKERDRFFQEEKEKLLAREQELREEEERLMQMDEERQIKGERERRKKEKEEKERLRLEEEEKLRQMREEEERRQREEEERLRLEFENSPEQVKKREMERLKQLRKQQAEARKMEEEEFVSEEEENDDQKQGQNGEAFKIRDWENESDDLQHDKMLKKKNKKQIEEEKKKALIEKKENTNNNNKTIEMDMEIPQQLQDQDEEENSDEDKITKIQRQCTNILNQGLEYFSGFFQGNTKKKKKTKKEEENKDSQKTETKGKKEDKKDGKKDTKGNKDEKKGKKDTKGNKGKKTSKNASKNASANNSDNEIKLIKKGKGNKEDEPKKATTKKKK